MRRMKFMVGLVCATMTLGLAQPLPAASPQDWDGLVQVKSSKMDVAFLSPGADFRAYKKVMLDKPEVAFQKNWMRDMNSNQFGKVDKDDAKKILGTVQSNTTDIFTEVFNKAGYEVVTEPGDDVLRVRSGVIDLYVNAPDTMSAGRTRSFTANAGEATLVLELRDSLTNALLGRVLDRRETRGMPGISNSVTNLSDYRMLAKQWAGISVKGLDQLKAHSPIPNPLKTGQKLN